MNFSAGKATVQSSEITNESTEETPVISHSLGMETENCGVILEQIPLRQTTTPVFKIGNLFSLDEIIKIKNELWTFIRFTREKGLENGEWSYKDRLHTFQGLFGFGYRKMFLPPSEWTEAVTVIKKKVETFLQ